MLRDGDDATLERIEGLGGDVCISILTRVELEGGAATRAADGPPRRVRLDTLLASLPCRPFDDHAADHYREIVEAIGYSRPRIIDRMIAAQALAIGAAVVTLNPSDFVAVPGLQVVAW